MQFLGKLSLLIVIVCYVSTTYGKQKTVTDTVVEGATHIKDNVVDAVSDGVKTGAKLASDGVKAGAKVASGAAKTAG
jgi:hypothetical protein